jgi:hypothetical protein
MRHGIVGLTVLAVALLWGCTKHSTDFWKEAEPSDVVRVAVASAPGGTAGKGGTEVAYSTDVAIEQTIDRYVEFFRARGVAPTRRDAQSAYFDGSRSGLCMIIERWDQGVGFTELKLAMDEADRARMAEAPGAYSILVPDDCSYAG